MALRPCKECRKEISSEAKVCPHCGKKVGTSKAVWFIAIICLLAVIGYVDQLANETHGGSPGGVAVENTSPSSAQPTWTYSTEADKMGRGSTETADLESVNEVNFDFPYNGGSKGVLIVRNSPKYGKDAILEVTKGQFLCDLENCYVNVRVDDGRPVRVQGNEAADGSSNVIFLPYATLLRDLRSAKVLRIEANFFQEGSRVFEFYPPRLDLRRLTSTK